MMRLTRKIQEKAARQPEKYEGYLIDSISPDGLYAYIAPMAMSTDDKEMQKLLTEGMAHGDEIDAADCMGEARQKDTVARIELNYANSTDPTIKHVPGHDMEGNRFHSAHQFQERRAVAVGWTIRPFRFANSSLRRWACRSIRGLFV